MSTRSYVQLKAQLLDETSVIDLAETFKVLGDTTRVRILDALARAEVPVCDLARLLGLTQSAVSHQLRLLRSMRLVKSRRVGRHIYYVADDHHIVGLFEQGLEHVQERASAPAPRPGTASGRSRSPAPAAQSHPDRARRRSRPASAGGGRRM
jgi:ArsR family transcriptional regulator, lead/cadmium/zinc/bismuth-responsive transcriptional repressor